MLGNSFAYFLCLLTVSGAAIGIFKTGALALIGDISSSTTEHTSTMNLVEGFFGVGAIVGPAIVTSLVNHHVTWKWLYAIAGTLCAALILVALVVRYPRTMRVSEEAIDLRRTMRMMGNPYALAFGCGALLYVAIEASVYVWGPLYLADYHGSWAGLASYAITWFFLLRAGGRFLGVWMLAKLDWSWVLVTLSLAILACLGGSVLLGVGAAVFLLPLSGLFMSVIYPTLNSKGISCFKKSEHGAVAGVILFFTCGGAVLGPLAMAALIDAMGDPKYAFLMAAGFAALLFRGLAVQRVAPADARAAVAARCTRIRRYGSARDLTLLSRTINSAARICGFGRLPSTIFKSASTSASAPSSIGCRMVVSAGAVTGQYDVVVSHDGDVVRDVEPMIAQRAHRLHGQHVAAGENGIEARVFAASNLCDGTPRAALDERRAPDQFAGKRACHDCASARRYPSNRWPTSGSSMSPKNAMRRRPLAIRCSVASMPPAMLSPPMVQYSCCGRCAPHTTMGNAAPRVH